MHSFLKQWFILIGSTESYTTLVPCTIPNVTDINVTPVVCKLASCENRQGFLLLKTSAEPAGVLRAIKWGMMVVYTEKTSSYGHSVTLTYQVCKHLLTEPQSGT